MLLRKDFVKINYTAWKYHKETIIIFQIVTSSIKIPHAFLISILTCNHVNEFHILEHQIIVLSNDLFFTV